MNYVDWEKSVPEVITSDSLWKMEAYRLALFASDLSWHDSTRLMQDKRTLGLAEQLYEAVGSINANFAEVILMALAPIVRGCMSMLLVQHRRVGIGITKAVSFSKKS